MAPKKPSLTAALADAPAAEPEPPVAEESRPRGRAVPRRANDTGGNVNIAAWFPPAVKYGLQELMIERSKATGRRVTLRDLMAEAFNDLFKKYGKAELAPAAEDEK